ncbi:MAG: hypothetical protein ABW133_02990 [Polyangiaceae bacterium]
MSTSTFVAMLRGGTLWAIHAQIVQAIVANDDWQGSLPFDVSNTLGIGAADDVGRHPILLLGAREKPAPLRALGSVVLKQVDVTRLWAVPELVRAPARNHAISAVALGDGEVPLVVLDPVTLLALAEEHRTS